MRDTIDAVPACVGQLRKICVAAGLADQQDRIAALFETLCGVAGLGRLPVPPRWSGVTDDCTPIEFSTSFDASQTKVRFLVEAQDDPASPASYWAAGGRLSAHLATMLGVTLEPLKAVEDLFAPTDPNALIAIWHSIEFRVGSPPLGKVYLSPAAHGRGAARAVLAAALRRLGLGAAVDGLVKTLRADDLVTHLSLDLVAGPEARVKVYVRHFRAAPADLVRRAEAGAGLDFADVCGLICPGAEVLWQRPVMTCYHFTAANRARPSGMTLYLPLHPYAPTDLIAAERIASLLTQAGFGAAVYRRIVADLIPQRRGGSDDGLHTYVAYQRNARGGQVTAYFNPRLFQAEFGRLALDPERFWPSPLT
jgi:DMATS type aromatic prenyltransferase